eukprot:3937698-Rhodomonas_salina.1
MTGKKLEHMRSEVTEKEDSESMRRLEFDFARCQLGATPSNATEPPVKSARVDGKKQHGHWHRSPRVFARSRDCSARVPDALEEAMPEQTLCLAAHPFARADQNHLAQEEEGAATEHRQDRASHAKSLTELTAPSMQLISAGITPDRPNAEREEGVQYRASHSMLQVGREQRRPGHTML